MMDRHNDFKSPSLNEVAVFKSQAASVAGIRKIAAGRLLPACGALSEVWSTDTDQCAEANEGAARHEIKVPNHSTAEAGTQQDDTAAENEVPAGRTQ
jgi:hypothetical protein